MPTPAEDEYDKLTPEQREIRDKEDRAREAQEQASMSTKDVIHVFMLIID